MGINENQLSTDAHSMPLNWPSMIINQTRSLGMGCPMIGPGSLLLIHELHVDLLHELHADSLDPGVGGSGGSQ